MIDLWNVFSKRNCCHLGAGFGLVALLVSPSTAVAQTAPSLGTAGSFAVLGGTTVTNTGTSVITGDLGVSPGAAVTGFPPGLVVGGVIHTADAVALQAQNDVTTAYNSLAGQSCTADLTGQDLGGMTLTPGVYCFSTSAQLTGTLTLNAQGNASAVFIFKTGSTLTTASGARVAVINGGAGCNVFWQVGSSATIGTGTTFVGNILALTSISLTTGATVAGRTLARNGAVTLDTNNVSRTVCDVIPGCPPITISPATSPALTAGVAVTQQLTASGGVGPYAFTLPSGNLPPGLTLTPNGVLSGTPTTAGSFSFSIRATDITTGCLVDQPYSIVVAEPVPTLSEWALIGLGLLLALAGFFALRARTAV